jgi:hypothetical protein
MGVMQTFVAAGLCAIVLVTVAGAQDPGSKPAESQPLTPEARIAAIEQELETAQTAFFKEYSAAKTDEERQQLFKEKYPRPEKWFPVLYEIAKSAPKTKGAEAALLWIVGHGGRSASAGEALDILGRDHLESEGVSSLASALVTSGSPKAEEFLKTLETRNPHKNVKGRALYARAELRRNLASMAEEIQKVKDPKELAEIESEIPKDELARLRALDLAKNEKEVEAILDQVVAKYADVEASEGVTLGDRARADLFEIRNLAIGKVAPDIEGNDVAGKPFKLSDHKGKVVVLDFWGHW